MCFRLRVMEAWGGMQCASILGIRVVGAMECASVLGFSVMGLWNVLPS